MAEVNAFRLVPHVVGKIYARKISRGSRLSNFVAAKIARLAFFVHERKFAYTMEPLQKLLKTSLSIDMDLSLFLSLAAKYPRFAQQRKFQEIKLFVIYVYNKITEC